MHSTSVSELISDLRTLGLSTGPSPHLPESSMPPPDVLDRWARAAAIGEPSLRQAAIWAIREAARANGLIPASIQHL